MLKLILKEFNEMVEEKARVQLALLSLPRIGALKMRAVWHGYWIEYHGVKYLKAVRVGALLLAVYHCQKHTNHEMGLLKCRK